MLHDLRVLKNDLLNCTLLMPKFISLNANIERKQKKNNTYLTEKLPNWISIPITESLHFSLPCPKRTLTMKKKTANWCSLFELGKTTVSISQWIYSKIDPNLNSCVWFATSNFQRNMLKKCPLYWTNMETKRSSFLAISSFSPKNKFSQTKQNMQNAIIPLLCSQVTLCFFVCFQFVITSIFAV